MKDRNKWISRAKKAATKSARQIHNNQKKGLFLKEQIANRARGLPVTGLWCRITMRKLVRERGDEQGSKDFKASAQWFNSFRKRWGFTFQEKTNVKKASVESRLPYVKKIHQYLLYTAFKEEA